MFDDSSSPISESPPLPLRLSILSRNNSSNDNTNDAIQKKKRKSDCANSSISDEENTPQMPSNLIIKTKTRDSNCNLLLNSNSSNKSPRIEQTDTAGTSEQIETTENISDSTCATTCAGTSNKDKMRSILVTSDINSNRFTGKSSYQEFNPAQRLSNCGTDVSSVSARKGWLQKFEKQDSNDPIFSPNVNENKFFGDQRRDNDNSHENDERVLEEETRQYPPPSSVITGLCNSGERQTPVKNLQRTPIISRQGNDSVILKSWRKGFKKEEIEATDNGHASVASLSKWLASDPTSERKKKHVRRGRNVISKSRQFEKDLENVVIMESNISRGAVGHKTKWLQSAFKSSSSSGENLDEDETLSTFSEYVQSDAGLSARNFKSYNRKGPQTEIITNDAACSLSVADKKDWLKEAFSTASQERKKRGGCASRAQTDVMYNRGKFRNDATSRAKMRFKERSARKLLNSDHSSAATGVTNDNAKMTSSYAIAAHNPKNVLQSNNITDDREPVFKSKKDVRIANSIEEDSTSVGFRKAREVLVQRSKQNGNSVEVVNKVFLRKKKFEKMEAESQRKSMGLVLKPSWDLGDSSKGHPSNAYEKRYFQDVAPKKSFEELP